MVCKAFFNAGTLPVFDYRDIREKGADLITTGGKAPGPEPLRICVEQLIALLREAVGRKLEPIEVHDMCCIIADAVLAGGIRRAAMICLFDRDDEAMLTCKSGEWWKEYPYRARANNSAVLPRGEVTELEFYALMERVEDSGCGEPGIYWTNNKDWGTNPCLTGDTKLLTDKGYVQLVDLVGKEFNNINKDGNISKGHVWSNGIKDIVEIKFIKAPSIRCTPDHMFMTTDGNGVEAKNLKGLRLMPYYNIKTSPGTPDDFKAGFLLGDGGLSRLSSEAHKGLEVFIGAKDLDVAPYFNVNTPGKFYSKENYRLATEYGLKESCTYDRELPNIVSEDFMMGLYSANGSVTKSAKRVSLKTTSSKLKDQVVSWLELKGMTPYVTTNKPTMVQFDNGEYLCKESYDINLCGINNLCKFASTVSFVHEYKQEALELVIKASALYVCAVKPAGREEVFDFNEPETHWGVLEGVVVHNCCEIALRPYQMCNLTEINAGAINTQREFNEAASAAAFIGTLQAGYTDFHYLNPKWKLACEKEALLGVSMTGIASGTVEKLDMEWASQCVIDTNREVAERLGINPAARSTCVKPAGTTSLVLGTSSGIHAWHAPYYIRRMRAGKDEALAQYMAKAAPGLVEQDVTKPNQVVLSFPQKAPEGATIRTEPMMSLLERVKNVSIKWVANGHTSGTNQHNVSCTISVKPDEWEDLSIWMWNNRDHYNGISVMPYFGAEAYPQLPFEDITKEQYEVMLPLLEGIDISKVFEEDGSSIDLAAELACAGGACEIKF